MHSHKDKEPEEFKVVDRRLFTSDGELRADLPPDTPEAAAPPPRPKPAESGPEPKAAPAQRAPVAEPPANPAARQAPKQAGAEAAKARPEAATSILMPDEMTPEQAQENPAGHLSEQPLATDQLADQAVDPTMDQGPVQFEHLIMSLVSTAMYQLGMAARPGEPPPRPDLRAAQETIDLLSLLTEKTKGNLTREEDALLSGSLQELRLAFVELARRAGRIR